jgi:hypothetical protein
VNEMDVSPDRIRKAGSGIRTSAQQLQGGWEAFQAELASFGQPWGNDDLGSLIGACYQAILEVAAECYAENIAEIDGHAEGVQTMAANFFSAEDNSVVEVNRVRDILG